jgi:hypothetical protein
MLNDSIKLSSSFEVLEYEEQLNVKVDSYG